MCSSDLKPIQEVYAQVTRLFETAPDLLEDFKQFLPESAAQAKASAARTAGEEAFPLSSTRTEPGYIGAAAAQAHLHQTPRSEQPRLPPMGNFAPTPSTNRDNKRKRGEKQQATAVTPTMQTDGIGPRAGAGQNNLISKVREIFHLSFLRSVFTNDHFVTSRKRLPFRSDEQLANYNHHSGPSMRMPPSNQKSFRRRLSRLL